jgi:Uma2 family endonuclease
MAALPRETVALKEQSIGPSASPDQLVRRFTLEEFEEMVNLFPDDQLELINGEIIMSPPPDGVHIEQTINVEYLLAKQLSQIEKLGCRVVGSNAWYAVPRELKRVWVEAGGEGPDHVCPDASVCYRDYVKTGRRPPALLVVEVLSVSSRSAIDRDLINKPDIYASLEIPAYWVVDRRDKSVWAHTAPSEGKYTRRAQYKGRRKLPAPGLEFLAITPAQVFSSQEY